MIRVTILDRYFRVLLLPVDGVYEVFLKRFIMKRFVLLSLFLVVMIAETLGVDLSLGGGLSVKNAYLYMIIGLITLEAVAMPSRWNAASVSLVGIHASFVLLIVYAIGSWIAVSFIAEVPGYEMVTSGIKLKNQLIDHFLVFIAFLYAVRNSADAFWIMKWIFVIFVAGNILTIIDVFNIPDLGLIHQRDDDRVSGPLGESNQYGAFMVLFLPGLAAGIWTSQGMRRFFYIFGFLISFTVLVLTASRGAMVGLICGSIGAAFYLRKFLDLKQAAKTATVMVVSLILAVVIAAVQYPELIIGRFVEKTDVSDFRTLSSGRTLNWTRAIAIQIERPISFLIGMGWETYKMWNWKDAASHNTYLNLLFSLGAVGLGLYIAVIWNLANVVRRAIAHGEQTFRSYLIGFVFGFAALSVAIFFVNLYKPWLLVWAYAGLTTRIAISSLADSATAAHKVQTPMRPSLWQVTPK